MKDTLDYLKVPFPVEACVRYHVIINRSPVEVWGFVGQADRLPEWFPGITDAVVDRDKRTITTGAGMSLNELIVTDDPIMMRFEYSLNMPLINSHKSTIDVFPIDKDTCLVSYQAVADPATLALVIAGAGANAIQHLKNLLEGTQ